jgi:hypothetical protein
MTRKLMLVYMAGDNNLDVTPEGSYCTRDIIELQRVRFSPDCRCFVQVDRGKTHLAQRGEIAHNPRSQEVNSGDFINIGKINTGDPKVLVDFIKWGFDSSKDKPDRVGLIIWGHGTGWKEDSYGAGEGKGGKGRGLFYHVSPSQDAVPRYPTHGDKIAPDYQARDSLNPPELEKALNDALLYMKLSRLEFLGFDACYMMELELLYSLRNYADAIIGSQEEEPYDGWPYDKIFTQYASKPEASGSDVGDWAVKAYIDYYRPKDIRATLSYSSTLGLQLLAESFDRVAKQLETDFSNYNTKVTGVIMPTIKYKDKDYCDLKSFLENLKEVLKPDDNLAVKIKACLDALNQCIPHPGSTGIGEAGMTGRVPGGISIYLPRKKPNPDTWKVYEKLPFNTEYPNWLRFLSEFTGNSPYSAGT